MLGRCYHYALETLFELDAEISPGGGVLSGSPAHAMGDVTSAFGGIPIMGKTPLLVHGFITGREGELKDQKFGHAWIEGNGLVLDCGSAEKSFQLLPRQQYYDFWQVDPAESRQYTIDAAKHQLLATGAITLWHPAPADALS